MANEGRNLRTDPFVWQRQERKEVTRGLVSEGYLEDNRRHALGQRELYARLNCLHGAKSSPLAATHLK
jgi:hypothetical protein